MGLARERWYADYFFNVAVSLATMTMGDDYDASDVLDEFFPSRWSGEYVARLVGCPFWRRSWSTTVIRRACILFFAWIPLVTRATLFSLTNELRQNFYLFFHKNTRTTRHKKIKYW
jgi:hypothetical protein